METWSNNPNTCVLPPPSPAKKTKKKTLKKYKNVIQIKKKWLKAEGTLINFEEIMRSITVILSLHVATFIVVFIGFRANTF